MDLEGKVALITGGARIGAAVARELAARGVSIVLIYNRSADAASETVGEIVAEGGSAVHEQADLTDPEQAAALPAMAGAWRGRLDILINMASHYERREWESLDAAAWDAHMNADARAAFLLAHGAAKWMRRGDRGGRIINVADWVAASGRPRYKGFVPYYAAQSAVIGLTEALALELAPQILVNAIAPGPILPPRDMSEAERAEVERTTPLGKWGGAGEIVKTVLFLIQSDFVTGECVRVDGGRHLR